MTMDDLEKRMFAKKTGETSILRGMLEDIESMLDDYYMGEEPLPDWFDNWIANVCIDVRAKLRENDNLHRSK
jgi:hypothetical protein